jgi:ATP-binding cassette subfamily B protein
MADKEQNQPQESGPKVTAPRKSGEDPVGKVYDSRLMMRLGHYLRPYWWQASLSALAVSLKSVCSVAGPYLVKVAIDRYLIPSGTPATNWLTRRLPIPSGASPSWPQFTWLP